MEEKTKANNLEEEAFSTNVFDRQKLSDSLKLMDGKFGGGFYVAYQFDKTSGCGFIELIFEYPDGEVFSIPLCKNVCKEINDDTTQDGVGKVRSGWAPDTPRFIASRKPPKIAPRLARSQSYGKYSEFMKYERPDFPIPMDVLWSRIIELWEKIPIKNWCRKISYEELYQALLDIGESKAEKNESFRDAGCVYLTKEEIEKTAEEMERDFITVRNVFEQRQLWKKDKNTFGYQYTKKIDGKNQRFYALKKMTEKKNLTQPNDEFAIAYTEKIEKKEIKVPEVK